MSLIKRIKQWQATCIPGPWKNVRDTVNGMNTVQDDEGEVIITTDYACVSQRCAALPDMEAALLAAEELADHVERDWDAATVDDFRAMKDALAAYREAVK